MSELSPRDRLIGWVRVCRLAVRRDSRVEEGNATAEPIDYFVRQAVAAALDEAVARIRAGNLATHEDAADEVQALRDEFDLARPVEE
jgi:hypothetical protein